MCSLWDQWKDNVSTSTFPLQFCPTHLRSFCRVGSPLGVDQVGMIKFIEICLTKDLQWDVKGLETRVKGISSSTPQIL